MSISAWAQACSAQSDRSTESLERSSYISNAFTVRFRNLHSQISSYMTYHLHLPFRNQSIRLSYLYSLSLFILSFRFDNACSTVFSRQSSEFHQIASFAVSFLVSAFWLQLWIRFKLRSRSTPAESELSSSESNVQFSSVKIWRHFGVFVGLVCAGAWAA
jgi:hypothetical protein